MKELRDIKLDLLMGNQNPIIDLFCEITSGIEIVNCNVYNEEGLEFIYFVPAKSRKNEWIFYQDSKNEKFWCSYKRYWSLFESNLRLEYKEIQAITKYLVEETLKREVVSPVRKHQKPVRQVEETLKREVVSPIRLAGNSAAQVEETLKREVTTPDIFTNINRFKVEEALKREVTTPFTSEGPEEIQVEDALKRNLEK